MTSFAPGRDSSPKVLMSSRQYLAGIVLAVLALLAVFVLSGCPSEQQSLPPDVVARVNGENITQPELRRVLADLSDLQARDGDSDSESDAEQLETRALKSLVQRRLLLQEAQRRNIFVSSDEYDSALMELRARFPDLASFGIWMRQRGLDDSSLIATVRDDLLVTRVTAALVQDVRVSATEIEEYYAAHEEDMKIGEEVRLRMIAVNSREAAEQILNALGEGEDFAGLARQLSLGTRAADGGDTGWVNPQNLAPAVRQAVAEMHDGEALGPVEAKPGEFLVIGFAGRRYAGGASLEEARPAIEQFLLPAKQQRAYLAWLEEQEKTASIQLPD